MKEQQRSLLQSAKFYIEFSGCFRAGSHNQGQEWLDKATQKIEEALGEEAPAQLLQNEGPL